MQPDRSGVSQCPLGIDSLLGAQVLVPVQTRFFGCLVFSLLIFLGWLSPSAHLRSISLNEFEHLEIVDSQRLPSLNVYRSGAPPGCICHKAAEKFVSPDWAVKRNFSQSDEARDVGAVRCCAGPRFLLADSETALVEIVEGCYLSPVAPRRKRETQEKVTCPA